MCTCLVSTPVAVQIWVWMESSSQFYFQKSMRSWMNKKQMKEIEEENMYEFIYIRFRNDVCVLCEWFCCWVHKICLDKRAWRAITIEESEKSVVKSSYHTKRSYLHPPHTYTLHTHTYTITSARILHFLFFSPFVFVCGRELLWIRGKKIWTDYVVWEHIDNGWEKQRERERERDGGGGRGRREMGGEGISWLMALLICIYFNNALSLNRKTSYL